MNKSKLKYLSILFLLPISSVIAQKNELNTHKEKLSYILGKQLTESLSDEIVDIDTKSFLMGIEDALNKKQSKLSEEDIEAVLKKMRQDQHYKQMRTYKDHLTAGDRFLDEKKKDPNVKSTPSKLHYEVMVQGEGKKPKGDDRVSFHYKAYLINGTEFANTYKRDFPANLTVDGAHSAGMVEGLKLMPVGSKYRFYVPVHLGHGIPSAWGIPNGALVIYEIELLEITTKN